MIVEYPRSSYIVQQLAHAWELGFAQKALFPNADVRCVRAYWEGDKEARAWRRGEPPHVGWWAASRFRTQDVWRWWDGSIWSRPVGRMTDRVQAGVLGRTPNKDLRNRGIWWKFSYPADARVPRVDPRVKS